jgi:hypothetical protein
MSHSGLNYFKGQLKINPAISEEYVESKFSLLASHWQKGDYIQVITQCEMMFEQNVFDVRFVVYYLYSVWVTPPRTPLYEVFESLNSLFAQGQDIWFPLSCDVSEGKVEPENSILSQCLSLLIKKVEQRIRQYDEELEQFDDCCDLIVDELDSLLLYLVNQWELDQLVYKINQLKKCYFVREREPELVAIELGDAVQICTPESSVDIEVEVDVEVDEVNIDSEMMVEFDGTKEFNQEDPLDEEQYTASDFNQPLPKLVSQDENTQGSEYLFSKKGGVSELLDGLILKTQLFEQLIQQGELLKAAVVADDIQNAIENFNPLDYLPLLFRRYAELRALNLPLLSQHNDYQTTPHWQALKDYYAIDMKGFTELELNTEFQEISGQATDFQHYRKLEKGEFEHQVNDVGLLKEQLNELAQFNSDEMANHHE